MPLIITPGQLNERAELYHQIGIMLAAGITLPQALDQVSQTSPRSLRPTLQTLQRGLREGLTLTDSIETLGSWIPSFDAALLEAGERSGRMDATFKLLATYYRDRAQMARQALSDLMYPLFVFHFAAVLFPFIEWFKTGNTFHFILSVVVILGPLYGVAFFIVYACQGRHGEHWRSAIESALRPIPMLGTARRFLALARLAAALEALINAGVSIVSAWELAATASGSPALRRVVVGWKEPLEQGCTPSELVSNARVFPELFVGLYHTGEVSGQLDETLRRLHTMYQEEGSRKLRAVAQWSPKLLYFGIMLIIGWKIVSFYSGLYGPNSDLDKALQGF
ncbi:MAG TPA: type II secretion system F family protein [Verrucomicrobiae bacterium]|jgi:type IV pilus assembly protein PilC|nr:type II secretion system F family protein [Verrucomicrobiae bacterium]